MSYSDAALLEKWRAKKDADAFSELLSRHASMVYGASLRVLRNPAIAEEVAQECFLELMKGPRGVRSIGAWLHTVATRRALDRLKAEGRRKEREHRYAAARDMAAEIDWDDTREFVDEAIAALPEELRAPIVLRFLEGRTHEAIAEELAVSRTTVRTRIDKGINAVRETLADHGVLIATGTLSVALEGLPAAAAPASIIAELGKRALAMRSGPAFLPAAAGAKYAFATVATATLVVAGAWIASRDAATPKNETAAAAQDNIVVAGALAAAPPAPSAPAPTSPPETPAVTPGPTPVAAAEGSDEEETPAAGADTAASDDDTGSIGWKLDLTPSAEVRETMQKTINVEFEDLHIKDVIEFIQDSFDLNIVLDSRVVAPESESPAGPRIQSPRNYVTDGIVRRLSQRDKTVEETLAILTSMLNLTYKIRGDVVWVSSSAQITQDLTVPLPSAPFRESETLDKLSKSVNIEFEDIHISDVVSFLVPSFNLNIVVDPAVVLPEPRKGEEPPAVTPDHATDGMIPYINLKDLSMAQTLFNVTRILDLTYRVDASGIYISTPDRVRGSF